jgi:hypothetical protein
VGQTRPTNGATSARRRLLSPTWHAVFSIPNEPNARGDSIFLAGARIWHLRPRRNLTLYRSTDGGSKWRTVALLHEGGSAPGDGDSSTVNLDSEAIGIIYSAGANILLWQQPVE